MQIDNVVYLSGNITANFEADGLVVEESGLRIPLRNINLVVVFSPARLSSRLLNTLLDLDIPISLIRADDSLRGDALAPNTGSIDMRIAQHRAYAYARPLWASYFAVGKLRNLLSLHNPLEPCFPVLQDCIGRCSGELADIIAAEALGTKAHYANWGEFLRTDVFQWNGRNRRPPRDPVNALMSFYSVLWTQLCNASLHAAGLDPQLGFLHSPRVGRASLACDLVEEFRGPIVERVCLLMMNRGWIDRSHFVETPSGVRLSTEGRAKVLRVHENVRRTPTWHPQLKHRIAFGQIPFYQARSLSRSLLHNSPYEAWRP